MEIAIRELNMYLLAIHWEEPSWKLWEGPLVSIWIVAGAVGLGVDSSPSWRFAREVAALCRLE